MRHLLSILAALFLCSAPAQAQTLKALMYNTASGDLVYGGTNRLTFPQQIEIADGLYAYGDFYMVDGASITADGYLGLFGDWTFEGTVDFSFPNLVRPNLGFSTNLNTLWTATNASNARTAIGLGATNAPTFSEINLTSITNSLNFSADFNVTYDQGTVLFDNGNGFRVWPNVTLQSDANISGKLVVSGSVQSGNNIIISNQSAATNGLLFVYRTNNEPFLGLANLIASNNTTVGNETLFRVGVAEATNRAAQFGFRATNTNGNGVAVFSVFGFNALMQIGSDASTNAVIYSGDGTNNEVMTLIRDGATEFARPLRFSTNASTRPSTNAPANTTNVAAWVEIRIGTNSYRVPLYQ